jgi:hypothetical protein
LKPKVSFQGTKGKGILQEVPWCKFQEFSRRSRGSVNAIGQCVSGYWYFPTKLSLDKSVIMIA